MNRIEPSAGPPLMAGDTIKPITAKLNRFMNIDLNNGCFIVTSPYDKSCQVVNAIAF